jgi:hypothetical protein
MSEPNDIDARVYRWAPEGTTDEWGEEYPWAISFGPLLEPVAMFTERAFAEAALPALVASVTEPSVQSVVPRENEE